MFFSKCSTPDCPPAAKENKNIFPKLHAFAQAAKAFRTCVPLLTQPSKIISSLSPTASEIAFI